MVEAWASQASVVLVRPTKARPTTGIIGAPHPITVQPPLARPSTLPAAPSRPPCRATWSPRPERPAETREDAPEPVHGPPEPIIEAARKSGELLALARVGGAVWRCMTPALQRGSSRPPTRRAHT